jgi:TolB-like protein
MAKVFSSACLVLVLCLGGAASASKPKIAILGLEVIPGPSGTIDPTVTQVARDVTTDLRQRVQSDASPYVMAQNSNKELTDEKLLMSCDNEAASCMAVIGAGLSADFLLYGHIEKRGEVYRVSVRLLDVKTRSFDTTGEDMPVGTPVATMSRRLYTRLFGEAAAASGGVLVVKVRTRSGTAIDGARVFVDDVARGVLARGKLTLTGIREDRHAVAIEAPGYSRFEETVIVRGGQPTTIDALIEAQAARSTPGGHAAVWKWSLGGGIALAIAGAGFAYYSNDQMVNHNKVTYEAAVNPVDGTLYTDGIQAPDAGDCGQSFDQIATSKHAKVTNEDAFSRACTWKTRIYIGYVVGGVGVLGAVVSLIMLTRDVHPSESSPTGTRGKKPGIAIAPIVRPDVAGASLSFSW